MVTLLKGCILFEDTIQVVDVESVEKYSSVDEADAAGDAYLNNDGDSYLVVENEEGIVWCADTYERYKAMLQTAS